MAAAWPVFGEASMDLDEPVDEIESEELTDVEEDAGAGDRVASEQAYQPRKVSAKMNRSRPLYIRKSITRLSVISDRVLKTKSDICAALEDYGHCLPPEQRAALEKWCNIN
jgi:hypothetical protein